eukprot:11650119-Prorocentrum_lima.AAC.1
MEHMHKMRREISTNGFVAVVGWPCPWGLTSELPVLPPHDHTRNGDVVMGKCLGPWQRTGHK